MSSDQIGKFLNRRPFEPFVIYTADGRVLRVLHPDFVAVGDFALSIWYSHPTGEIELIDVSLVTSMRTIGAVDSTQFIGD